VIKAAMINAASWQESLAGFDELSPHARRDASALEHYQPFECRYNKQCSSHRYAPSRWPTPRR